MLYPYLFEVGGDHRLLFEALEKLLIPYQTHFFPEVAKTIYLNWDEDVPMDISSGRDDLRR